MIEPIAHALSRDILYLIGYDITTKDKNWSGTEAILCMLIPAVVSALIMRHYYGIQTKRLVIISTIAFFVPNLIPNLMLFTELISMLIGLCISMIVYSIIYRYFR